jgi:hypothetical protein
MKKKHETRRNASLLPNGLWVELEKFNESYNKRLYKLLNWGSVWGWQKLANFTGNTESRLI